MAWELLEEEVQGSPSGAFQAGESIRSGLGSLATSGLRTGARGLARGAESVAGLPGDIAATGLGLAGGLTGINTQPVAQYLPTSQNIREQVTQRLTGDVLEPQNSTEAFFDDVVSDAAAFLVPGGIAKGAGSLSARAIASALGKSTVGNIAQWGAEGIGAGPLGGTAAKIGALALTNTIGATRGGREALERMRSENYDKARDYLGQRFGGHIPKKPTLERLKKVRNALKRRSFIDRGEVLGAVDNVINGLNKPKGGGVTMSHLWDLKKDINERLYDPKRDLHNSTRQAFHQILEPLNKELGRYAKNHPEFGIPYNIGEDITRGMHARNQLRDFMTKVGKKFDNKLVHSLLWGIGHGLGPVQLGTTAAGIGASISGMKAYDLISNSAVARKYYKEALQSAFQNDARKFSLSVKNLSKVANNWEKKQPSTKAQGKYELVD